MHYSPFVLCNLEVLDEDEPGWSSIFPNPSILIVGLPEKNNIVLEFRIVHGM
jgi:hypothetical protein